MSTIIRFIFHPVLSLRKNMKFRRQAFVDDCPPPTIEQNDCEYGSYCMKATVETTDYDGISDRLFVGYSQDMSIVKKTETACERFKRSGTKCGEVSLVIKGGDCDEALFMRKKNGDVITII